MKAILRAVWTPNSKAQRPNADRRHRSIRHVADIYQPDAKKSPKYGAKYGDYLDDFAGDKIDRPALLQQRFATTTTGPTSPRTARREPPGHSRQIDQLPRLEALESEYCVMDGPLGKGGVGRDQGIDTALDVARVITTTSPWRMLRPGNGGPPSREWTTRTA